MAIESPPRPPSQDELDALIPEARNRHRRRQLLGAATVVAGAALALAVYAVARGSGLLQSIGNPLGLGGASVCRTSQLKSQGVLFIGLMGTEGEGGVGVTNTSSTACSLPAGAPRVTLSLHGQQLAVRQIHVAHPFRAGGEPVVHVLQPGQSAQVDIGWRNWCGPPKLSNYQSDLPTIHFRFRGGAATSMRFGPKAACTAPGSPSTITATRPLHWRAP